MPLIARSCLFLKSVSSRRAVSRLRPIDLYMAKRNLHAIRSLLVLGSRLRQGMNDLGATQAIGDVLKRKVNCRILPLVVNR